MNDPAKSPTARSLSSEVTAAYERPNLDGVQKISFVYLLAVPLLTFLLGFGVGHVSYWYYLPAWLINSLVMAFAIYQFLRARTSGNTLFTVTVLLLISPWIIFPVFGGMGRPPQSVSGWLELVTEQQIRYDLLILGGTLAYLGTFLLFQWLRVKETLFATLGIALMTLSIPLFCINMAYWGSFLSESFRNFKSNTRPDWYLAFKELFGLISTVEVTLIYLATSMFVIALGQAGYFKPAAVRAYCIVSLSAALINMIPPSAPDPFATLSYLVAVPAIPFIMLYLIGVNLLRIGQSVKNTVKL